MTKQHQQGEIRPLLETILSAHYSQFHLREFVELCYFIALPLVRKKITTGRLKPDRLGMNEGGIVYDCLADIFQRDVNGRLVQLEQYINVLDTPFEHLSETDTFIALRRLIFGAINRHIPRLYADLDPALGKILRNIKLAVDRSELFEFAQVFGETCLSARNLELQIGHPPWSTRDLTLEFSRIVTLNDNIPAILTKLYGMMLSRSDVQRRVPLIAVALLVKETYALGWEQTDSDSTVVDATDGRSLQSLVENACERVWNESRESYLASGKKSEAEYGAYLRALKEILLASANNMDADSSYFSILRTHMGGLTEEEYRQNHRSVLEYMVRRTRKRLRSELRAEGFGDTDGV